MPARTASPDELLVLAIAIFLPDSRIAISITAPLTKIRAAVRTHSRIRQKPQTGPLQTAAYAPTPCLRRI